MREVVSLTVTSFRASIGGEHYYGKLYVHEKTHRVVEPDGHVSYRTLHGHGAERHPHAGREIQRRLGAKEAAYLTKKDSEGFFPSTSRIKPGDLTTRFNDVESLLAAAVSDFADLFDPDDVLLFERKQRSDEYEVVIAPDEIRAGLADKKLLWDQEDWLRDNGYLVKASDDDADVEPPAASKD